MVPFLFPKKVQYSIDSIKIYIFWKIMISVNVKSPLLCMQTVLHFITNQVLVDTYWFDMIRLAITASVKD